MTGWLADFFRFWWGLLYWNWRKMRFQQKGRRGRCPCQSPSDSGKGYETQCEAAMSWVNQRRFKRLCPLLVETPQGLRCAAHTAEVRPFWRIPLAYYGGACLSLYLILTLGAFVFLRTLGYPIGYGTVSWPGYWHEFPKIQAQYYKDRGMKAYQAGDLRGASMSLYLAHSIDPSLYDCALINAQISTLAAPNQADETFRVLMQQHPEQADNTAEFWLRSIVARGSFNALRGLALERLQNAKSGSPAPWLHALLIATRQLGDSNSLAKFAQSPKGEPWRTLLQTELLLRADRNEEATQALLQAWQPQDTYKAYYQCCS